jgi:flagellum-specific ATP synthase
MAAEEPSLDLSKYFDILDGVRPMRAVGHVSRVVGLTIESAGPPASVGEECLLTGRDGRISRAEVVGFTGHRVFSMPLDRADSIRFGDRLVALRSSPGIHVSDSLLGRVLDPTGSPVDGGPRVSRGEWRALHADPPDAMTRPAISDAIPTGIRSLDGLLTCGRGQRLGIFAGSGVGKSTLLGMIARHSSADINVIGLVGERGREVREFIENDLGAAGLARSVIFVSTSDEPPLRRIRAALAATAAAEHFRDAGANVMLMMDSITRVAMAQREIGLASGEPPSSKGYTPSVFSFLPRLLERAGRSERGSITGIYTVYVEGDDLNDPIADAARSLLDGHVVLSREIAQRNHYPAVDILGSVSRLMPAIVTPEQNAAAGRFRRLLAVYRDSEDLVRIGAYKPGMSEELDLAIGAMPAMNGFLMQDRTSASKFEETVAGLSAATGYQPPASATPAMPAAPVFPAASASREPAKGRVP